MKTLTQNELCRRLAGYEKNEILCSETRHDGTRKRLILKFRLAGFFDEVIPAVVYWVQYMDVLGERTECFVNIDEALKFYAGLY